MFVLSKLLWALVAPGTLLVSLLVVGLGAQAFGRRWGRAWVWLAAAGFVALAVLPVGDWLMRPLEERFPPPAEALARVDGIIVLGGAINPVLSLARHQPALNQAADRMTAFAALARHWPEARLVFTGGSGALLEPGAAEAPVARSLLGELGLDPARVIFEDGSRNTYENAVLSKALASPQPGQIWLLVTSAWHMPRAVGVFRQAGWPVVAWPVDYRTLPDSGFALRLDLSWGLDLATDAVKEWIGLAAYRMIGRTSSLLPAP
ncbi:MAG: YdcF family protein [Azospirillum sp.]|nr:YdcF family protein [Azospirillum sp.]